MAKGVGHSIVSQVCVSFMFIVFPRAHIFHTFEKRLYHQVCWFDIFPVNGFLCVCDYCCIVCVTIAVLLCLCDYFCIVQQCT